MREHEGKPRRPEIVAELSCNHLGDLGRALALVDAAADSGADAVKLQCWRKDGMALDCLPPLKSGPWAGRTLADLYREAWTPWDWFPHIIERAQANRIAWFASAFDRESVAFLESLDCPRYKVASFEITDLPLIRCIAGTRKPVVISTGMATWQEIGAAAHTAGCAVLWANFHVTLLRCTSAYPALVSQSNLLSMRRLCDVLPVCRVGLSDHTMGHVAAVVATALGADMIEKHLTLLRADGGPDAGFSAEPAELWALVTACRDAAAALGSPDFGPTDAERDSLQFRRGLWVVENIAEGGAITADNVRSMRPAGFMPPSVLPEIIGRKAARTIARGEPLTEGALA